MAEGRKFIGEYLLEKGVITKAQLEEAMAESRRSNLKIGEILVRKRYATEEDIGSALSEQLGFPFLDLATYKIEKEALKLVPREVAERLLCIPVFRVGDSITVAMSNPLDIGAIDEIERLEHGIRVTPVISTPSGIKKAIEEHYKGIPSASYQRIDAKVTSQVPQKEIKGVPDELLKEAAQASVIKIVNEMIESAVMQDASDIHLEPGEGGSTVRFRIDGVLHKTDAPEKDLERAVTSRIKIMADIDIAQTRLPQDGRIEMRVKDRQVDLRVATFPTIYGEHVSLRILDKSQGVISIDKLGFQPEVMKKFQDMIHKPYGFILITGPTGSGKTTTLYAALNRINNLKKNIITLEDPVEYTIPNIHQSQINVKAGLTFASGLRSIVRMDPDIIMIGEIRDKETADIAIQASLTGHLVFSTLHTNDAPSCATRLVDIGVEPYMVSSSVIGILAQRLVRKLCPKCKKEYKPAKEEVSVIEKRARIALGEPKFFNPVGCKACSNIGYKGRTGIFELLVPTDEIKELIVRKAPSYEIKNASQKAGMKTLYEDGIDKVKHGITSLSELLRVTEES